MCFSKLKYKVLAPVIVLSLPYLYIYIKHH